MDFPQDGSNSSNPLLSQNMFFFEGQEENLHSTIFNDLENHNNLSAAMMAPDSTAVVEHGLVGPTSSNAFGLDSNMLQQGHPHSYNAGLSSFDGPGSFIQNQNAQMDYDSFPQVHSENFQQLQVMDIPNMSNMSNQMLMPPYSTTSLTPNHLEAIPRSDQYYTNQGSPFLPPNQNLFTNSQIPQNFRSEFYNQNNNQYFGSNVSQYTPNIMSQSRLEQQNHNYNQWSAAESSFQGSQNVWNMSPPQNQLLTTSMHQVTIQPAFSPEDFNPRQEPYPTLESSMNVQQNQFVQQNAYGSVMPAAVVASSLYRNAMRSNIGQQQGLVGGGSNSVSSGSHASSIMHPSLYGSQNIFQATVPSGNIQRVTPHVQQQLQLSQSRPNQMVYSIGMINARLSTLHSHSVALNGPTMTTLQSQSATLHGPTDGTSSRSSGTSKDEIVQILRKVETAEQNKQQQEVPAAPRDGVTASQRDKGKLPASPSTGPPQSQQVQTPAASTDRVHANQCDKGKLPQSPPTGPQRISRLTFLVNNQMAIPAPSTPSTQQNQQGVVINQNIDDPSKLGDKEEPPVRRGRGRPPRQFGQRSDLSNLKKGEKDEAPKRQLGRPRKLPQQGHDLSNLEKGGKEEPSKHRRPGRPRKRVEQENESPTLAKMQKTESSSFGSGKAGTSTTHQEEQMNAENLNEEDQNANQVDSNVQSRNEEDQNANQVDSNDESRKEEDPNANQVDSNVESRKEYENAVFHKNSDWPLDPHLKKFKDFPGK